MARPVASTILALRPATADDAAFAADVMTAVRPSSPTDPVVLEYWWRQPDEFIEFARYIVTRSDRQVGYAETIHARWDVKPERYASVGGDLMPSARSRESLDALFAIVEDRLIADGGLILRARANEDDPLRIDTIVARGYKEDRRARRWELDLVKNRERLLAMTDQSRKRMRDQGVRLLTLAEDHDPGVVDKIWRLSEEAGDDVPTTVPRAPEAMEAYVRWVKAPGIHRDRFWIARLGDEVVGVSVLEYPPVRGIVSTDWTATARSARGRGIARALKCETVAQAIALGVDRLRTGNDAANDPILHINESMGYTSAVGNIKFLKDV